MVAALTMSILLVPQCQEVDSGEEACASVNQISALVM